MPSNIKDKLINIAGKLFAEQGFKATTIRQICQKADVNIAAINYHFGDKQELYNRIVEHIIKHGEYDHTVAVSPDHSAEEKLKLFIQFSIKRQLGIGIPEWHSAIMEEGRRTHNKALHSIMVGAIHKRSKYLREIIKEITGLPDDSPEVAFLKFSILGQIHIYMHHLHREDLPDFEFTREPYFDKIVSHLYDFSITGMKNYKK